MKHIAICLPVLIAWGTVQADPQKLNIERATVYLSGAELLSTAHVNLQKGENEVVFSNIAGNVTQESIVVNTTNGVAVQSV
ncbi:MAG: DUF4140 domain-containing protein, partial [Chitinophagia bacterium]|nr:DUF4140 domain-containing protein [Chitinophagia bacterium]